jgi:catechol 2,3-dioxygenase-like lactoylglutathione lyase family enzyme
MISVNRLLETALYVADLDRSCDFYERVLGLGPDVGTTAEKENQKRFRSLQIPGGQVLLLFTRGFATTAAVLPGGTIPPHDGNGRLHLAFAISATEIDAWREHCKRTAYQSKARRSGRVAERAFISAIPMVTLWKLPRLGCGRFTDEDYLHTVAPYRPALHLCQAALVW